MAWSYDWQANPTAAAVRLMVADTDSSAPIFSDEEIAGALQFTSAQGAGLYISSMFASTGAAQAMTNQVQAPRLAAAMLLESLASDKARLASVTRLLDVEMKPYEASKGLREQAKCLREAEENSGSFAIAEMVSGQFQARERTFKQFLRIYGG